MTTDASNVGAGAILSQGETGKDRQIANASHNYNKAEKNYSVVEKELAEIDWGLISGCNCMVGSSGL